MYQLRTESGVVTPSRASAPLLCHAFGSDQAPQSATPAGEESGMTAQEIRDRLFFSPTKPRVIDAERVRKAQGLALRSRVEWQAVLDVMTDDQRKAVADAGQV